LGDSNAKLVSAMHDVSASLFKLRDALLDLSLFLKDWQFEADLELREKAAAAAHQLLQPMRLPRGPGA